MGHSEDVVGASLKQIAEMLGVTEEYVVKAYYYYRDACGETF